MTVPSTSPAAITSGAVGAGALVALIWGLNFVVADIALVDVPPLMLVGLRYLVVGLLFLPFTRRGGIPLRYLVAVGLLSGVVQFGGLFLGMALGVGAGVASVVLQSQALFTVLFARFIVNERYRPRQWLGLLLGAAGLLVVASAGGESAPAVGILVVLAGGAGWASANIVLRKAGPISAWSMTVWQSVVVVPALLVLSLVFERGQIDVFREMTLFTAGAVLYIALLSTAVANLMWYRLIQQIGAARAAPFSLLVPVVGVVGSVLILGEQFTVSEAVGVGLTLVGVILINIDLTAIRDARAARRQPVVGIQPR